MGKQSCHLGARDSHTMSHNPDIGAPLTLKDTHKSLSHHLSLLWEDLKAEPGWGRERGADDEPQRARKSPCSRILALLTQVRAPMLRGSDHSNHGTFHVLLQVTSSTKYTT